MALPAAPAGSDSKVIDPQMIGGLKKLADILPMLISLREVGCERDKPGNRRLHFDEYVTLVLLYMFNPLIDSVRMLQQASALEKVSEALGVKRFSLGSFSESVRVFDPEKLRDLVLQFGRELKPVNAARPGSPKSDPSIKEHLSHTLTIVDGTVLDAISTVAAAVWLPFQDGTTKHAWKLHTQFDFDLFIPTDVELTDARNSGKSDEKNVLRDKLAPDHCYVMDRWYGQFTLFNQIKAAGSSYVCRVKENSVFEVQEERLLSDEALKADVVRDAVVTMGLSSKPADKPDHLIRLIVIEATPHEKRGGRRGKTAGPGNKGTIVIATNLLDVPAEIIALIYQHRWAIEVFFRFFKQTLGCRHLLSHKPEGIQIQIYCAILACMMINLWTGKRPNKATVNILAWYFAGVATEAEVMAEINKLNKKGVKLAEEKRLLEKLGC